MQAALFHVQLLMGCLVICLIWLHLESLLLF
jgi:hypothetical protein